ncbi:penicillin-binding protein activator [Lutimaribacter sp. EGI FJ00015]|uniref:Penicillin-binding protein activator n=1 Tax=Lutimaribacter degradans TaxID=2945989 RepID=A0ACC6A017_9RHOB|nr:penicillin-binding protein activator [Lutimaribacter sp. EGI FJ00013]MCM2563508.1 penicillin-binding protein activator [Lutimaribacter sp. EGI FJ00013]MCO0614688.1 penicillin-binding protein activator [Lutimaribacter sp. EGI FJ00015]MCO0637358.1 penicillin-binding protein activator [Lutimaribacter sp. EGI FJ00014]
MFAVLSSARKVLWRAIALMSITWLAACQTASVMGPAGGPTINPRAPVPVALLVPRGSENSGDDALADSLENAARLAISDLDGVAIDLRVYSTAGNAAQAQQAAQQAAGDGARIILGPVYAESANAVAVAMEPRNINVLSFSNNSTIAGGNLWVLGPTFQNTADRLVSYARNQGKSRFVVAHSNNVSGQLGKQAIQQAVSANGGTLVGAVSHDFSQEGVVNAVPQIVSSARSGDADAVFMTANSAGALPLLTQMLPEAGLGPDVTQYIGLTRWDIPPQTLDLPGVQGGWFAMPDPNKSAAFRSRYQAANGNTPHPIAGLAYDGIAAIGALVKTSGRDALSGSSLTQSAGFQGTGGIFRLLPDGTNQRSMAIATIRNKQVVVIDPASNTFGDAGS